MDRRPTRPPRALGSAGPLIVLLAACAGGPSAPTTSPAGTVPDPPPSAASTAPATPAASTASEPPVATLAAEGGDPVVGQLGTFTWGDSGSDAPWLPGEPITVGAGEPLGVRFDPAMGVDSWSLSLHPPDADGPAGGTPMADGSGEPTAVAPAAGRYTLLLEVRFADGTGSAVYAWQLDVR